MTIGVAFLWWLGSLIGVMIIASIIAILVGIGIDDDLGSGLATIFGVIIALVWKVTLIGLFVWWVWVMFTQGINPFEALDYRMW